MKRLESHQVWACYFYIQQFANPDTDTEHLEFFSHITNPQDYTDVDLSEASHGHLEIVEIAFVDPATTNVLPNFLSTEDISAQISEHEPSKIFNYPT